MPERGDRRPSEEDVGLWTFRLRARRRGGRLNPGAMRPLKDPAASRRTGSPIPGKPGNNFCPAALVLFNPDQKQLERTLK